MKRTIPDKYTIKLTIPDHVKSRRSYIHSSPTQFTINKLLDISSFCIVFNFCWFTSVSCNPKATTLSSLSLFCVFSSVYPSLKSWWSILSTIYLSCSYKWMKISLRTIREFKQMQPSVIYVSFYTSSLFPGNGIPSVQLCIITHVCTPSIILDETELLSSCNRLMITNFHLIFWTHNVKIISSQNYRYVKNKKNPIIKYSLI